MHSGPKILVIGGGSVQWTPTIIRDILLTPSIADPSIVLYDINRAAAEKTACFLRKLAREIGVRAGVVATNRRPAAFDGAQYAIITISTGGLDAMAEDLSIPERFGIYQTVGDTAGPGGWARFIRNYPVFVDLAEALNRHARGCAVLNYTNPMCTLTDVLSRRCAGPVVGLCHGLFENIEFLKSLYQLKDESELTLHYGGLNHFFWVTQAHIAGKDVVADLRQKLERKSFGQLAKELPPDPVGYRPRKVATELFRATGVLPYLGDRHTSEFLSCYANDPATLKRYKLERTNIAQRRQWFREADQKLDRLIDGPIDKAYTQRTRETAADIIDAHLNNRPFVDVGNLPNVGQIDNLPRGVVVETAVRIDQNGIQPITFGPLPDAVLGLVQPHASAYALQVRACLEGKLDCSLQALRFDPLCSRLTAEQIERMGHQLLQAHAPHIKGLFHGA